ncbi:acyltransferase family protein [Antarcticirhabdus aurantiaca]|uniref:Acyltransferase n=1 Tax=Antarcticirhabdus aurantiaca TaxID=2606717 RepID=A0ACD4NII0_9HYPH|nr:acyltransferase [Antarcticirhabdus aurantiaca]WAJ26594.1 acyltransferase [Jeongeuplla avenae]
MGRENGFTALRLIAAVLVIFTHPYVLGANIADPVQAATGLLPASTVGVDLFFVVSGYLISGSLRRSASFGDYLRNRALRILPALFVLCAVTVFVIGPLATTSDSYFRESETYAYFRNALVYAWQPFLPGVFETNTTPVVNGSLWTLPIEATCYGFLLVMAWCGCFNWRGALVLMLMCYALVVSQAFPFGQILFHYEGGMELRNLSRFTALFAGGALIKLIDRPWTVSPAVTLLAGLGVAAALAAGQIDWRWFPAIYLLAWPWLVIGLAARLSAFSALDRVDISYGLYLYAFPIQQLLVQVNGGAMDPITLFLISAAVTTILALASWFLIERPAMRLKAGGAAFRQHRSFDGHVAGRLR